MTRTPSSPRIGPDDCPADEPDSDQDEDLPPNPEEYCQLLRGAPHRPDICAQPEPESDPAPALGLSLRGEIKRIIAEWPGLDGAARYLVRWRSSEQPFGSDRQMEVQSGSAPYSVAIYGLDSDTAYWVRVAAFDDQDREVAAEEHSVQVVSANSYIESNIIEPLKSDSPWMQEAWFDVPVEYRVVDRQPGTACPAYLLEEPAVQFCGPFRARQWPVLHELAHHYIVFKDVHADDPAAKLSILSLWLHQMDHDNHIPWLKGREAASVAELLLFGTGLDNTKGTASVSDETAALARSVSQQEIPQWFFDTYTTDGTLETADLDRLWADLRGARRNAHFRWYAPKNVGAVFGGYCSEAEGRWALETAQALNAWVDGGCVNRQPQALTATGSATGELTVAWEAPLYATTPDIDAYVVQWKTGDEDYDTARQAIVTDLDNLTYTITGLATGTDFAVRVAAVNQEDTADYADDDGRGRAAETIVPSELDLSWWGDHERIVAKWQPVIGAASYLFQWRSGDQSYDDSRQRVDPAGQDSYSFTIGGLDNGAAYTVRIAALDNQGEEISNEEQPAQPVSGFDQIEDNLIVPYQDDYPWLHEAWFDAPAKVTIVGSGYGYYLYWVPEVQIAYPYYRNSYAKWVVWHELFHHYSLHPSIHSDNPTARLSITSLWLFEADRKKRFPAIKEALHESITYRMNEYMDPRYGFLHAPEETLAAYASVSRQEIPQWFYDTYTSDGTIDTVDLDLLWADLRDLRRHWVFKLYSFSNVGAVFGGYCSDEEGRWALNTAQARNAWVDGGCANRRPQALTAVAGGAGDLVVTWQAPLYTAAPDIDAYVVQWKTGSEDYDTARQAIVTDLDNLSHTITGLTTGIEYEVRVAAVNQTDAGDFADDDGRARTAETSGAAG